MKHFYHFFTSMLMAVSFCSCSDDILMDASVIDEDVIAISDEYSMDEIFEIANSTAHMYDGVGSGSRSTSSRIASRINAVNLGRNESRSGESKIYAVDYNDSQGFVLVSKKRIDEPVLAFIEKGDYTTSVKNSFKNGGINAFLALAEEYVNIQSDNVKLRETALLPNDSIKFPIEQDTTVREVSLAPTHMIQLAWGQEDVFGSKCPNGTAGCAQIALAQLMTYYQVRDTFYMSYQYDEAADLQSTLITFDWSKIKTHASTQMILNPNYNPLINPGNKEEAFVIQPELCTEETHEQIGHLLREIGERTGAIYQNEATSTLSNVAIYQGALRLGLQANRNIMLPWDFSITSIKSKIRNKYPCVFFGENVNGGKHVWLCDGYWYKPSSDGKTYTDMFYYNWGYDGLWNGYFVAGVFDLGKYILPFEYNVRFGHIEGIREADPDDWW